MPDQVFDEVHLFLDESGDLPGNQVRNDLLLVGGVLYFGKYDRDVDGAILTCLQQSIAEAGGTFPESLHFYGQGPGRLSPKSREQFLQTLNTRLPTIFGKREIGYGVFIRHEKDIFHSSSHLLGENHLDNRYLSMMWSLVEHLLFVDQSIRDRLSPQATAHISIANRGFSFAPSQEGEKVAEGLGYDVRDDARRPGYKFVRRSVESRDLLGMLRMARRQRWGDLAPEVASVGVPAIRYDRPGTSALLYLADLYLGGVRLQARGGHGTTVLETICELPYSSELELTAQMQSELSQGNLQRYLEVAEDYCQITPPPKHPQLISVTSRQEHQAAELLVGSPTTLGHLAENACREVDRPGMAETGYAKVKLAQRLLKKSRIDDLRTLTLLLQARLSHANHTGNLDHARQLWESFLAREADLLTLNSEGLRLKAAIRNRRAISLTDRFHYEEAITVLAEVVSQREELLAVLARLYGVPVDQLPAQELGECLGSLGQVHCFRGTDESRKVAEACFRRAIQLFVDPSDTQRQWIYLGHLACDLGIEALPLWEEVCRNVPELASEDPVTQRGLQYRLALQLKGALVFKDDDRVQAFTRALSQSNSIAAYSPTERQVHPFGLIRQCSAMLHARCWRLGNDPEEAEQANRDFQGAVNHFASHSGILRLLKYIANLRHKAFRLEIQSATRSAKKEARDALLELKSHAIKHFGEQLWGESTNGQNVGVLGSYDPGSGSPISQRVEGVLSAIRFNYW